jgi:small subunit ribosomal protein S8
MHDSRFKIMTDPISDMLIRIKNAQAVNKETVVIPFSKMKQEIAGVLKQSHMILDYEKKGRSVVKKLEIKLKYTNSFPAITNTKRISKPGQRIYMGKKEIFSKGRGIVTIISTSRGIMTSGEARKAGLGGEVLCEIS